MTAALIWCPFGSMESAEAAAGTLLEERLIACANILPAVRSLYRWQGERGEGTEVGVLFKTRADLLDAAVARLEVLHPYDSPAIAGWRCDGAGAATLAWLEADCGPAQT
ncbi:MAG: divalent-cation tolerance protein CutA [Novosphingobium meiothermophilum]|uniref:divalent-cation tolerance protein CutA n=1 Tax=Novosphingobium TaxID=165696 RepID=UPI000D6E3FC2|nr:MULTISPECIES: divalent-cation tolerance protein CutA [Novosphingobium]